VAEFITKTEQNGKMKSTEKFETAEKHVGIFQSKRENSHTRNFLENGKIILKRKNERKTN
jgi:hypothetical protein